MRRPTWFISVVATVQLLVVLAAASSLGARVAASQAAVADVLQAAMTQYREGNHRNAESACNGVILNLQALPSLDSAQLGLLVTAYELRARARFAQRDAKGAREDFKSILTRIPSHEYGSVSRAAEVTLNPDSQRLFEEVRAEVVGSLVLTVTPADAEVKLDGVVVPADQRSGQGIRVVPGLHTISAAKSGYRRREESVFVAAGPDTPLTWGLERLTSTIDIITAPAGVEVWLDGKLRGRTPPGPPQKHADAVDVVALGAARELSGILEITDVPNGTWNLEFRLECHVPLRESRPVDVADDYRIAKKLIKSWSPFVVRGREGTVFVDGVQQGTVPYEGELCPKPQPQEIEIRSDRGRQIQRVSPVAGTPVEIIANPKATIAVLSQLGVPDGFPADLRRELENALASAEAVTFIAIPPDLVQKEMAAAGVQAGWLSFNQVGRPLELIASAMTPSRMVTISSYVSQNLYVQGVAEIRVEDAQRDFRKVLFTYLAKGSGRPETIELKLDDPQGSVSPTLARFNLRYPTSRVSAGLEVADIQGAGGAVVLRQVWDLTNGIVLAPGDVILSADERKIEDGSAFDALVASKKAGDQIALQVKGKDGVVKTATLRPASFPLVVGFLDETLPINKLILDFRTAVLDARDPRERSIARLNLGVVLMRAGNSSEALIELEKVELEDLTGGQAVSRGTAQYYLGLCLEALGRHPEAVKAFQAAAASPGALLTGDDNTLVKPLAEEKLKPRR